MEGDAKSIQEAIKERTSKNLTREELDECAEMYKLDPIRTKTAKGKSFYRVKQAKTDVPAQFEVGTWDEAWDVVTKANCVFRFMTNPKKGEYLKIMRADKVKH